MIRSLGARPRKARDHFDKGKEQVIKMKSTMKKVLVVISLAALVGAGVIWEVRRASAFNPQPDPPGFGMVGITRAQTIRLNVVNLSNPPEPDRQLPPDPCRVVLSFRNSQGQPFTNGDGQPVRRVVELQAGESAFLDLNGEQLLGSGDTTAPARAQLRPFVRVQQGPSGKQAPPDPCFPTVEVFDNATGRTSLFASPNLVDPPDPDRQQ
jgi:hypothetical protein